MRCRQDCLKVTGYLGGAVAAVVRAYYDVDKVLGIVLRADAVDELAYDGLLVSRGDEHRNALAAAFEIRIFPLSQEPDGYVCELIRIAQKKYAHYYKVDLFDSAHALTSNSFVILSCPEGAESNS